MDWLRPLDDRKDDDDDTQGLCSCEGHATWETYLRLEDADLTRQGRLR